MYREFRLQPVPAGATRREAIHLSTTGTVIKTLLMKLDTTNVGFETQPNQTIRIVAYKGDEVIDTADFKIKRDCPALVQFFLKRDTVTVPVDPARVQTLLPSTVSPPTPPSGEQPAPPAAPVVSLETMTVPQKLAAGYRPVSKDGKVTWEIPQ